MSHLTNTTSEETNEQFNSRVSNIKRDHKKQSLHIPMTRPNTSKKGQNKRRKRKSF